MQRRKSAILTGVAVLCGGWWVAAQPGVAQQDGTVHPITSLPKPPGYVAPEATATTPDTQAVPAAAVQSTVLAPSTAQAPGTGSQATDLPAATPAPTIGVVTEAYPAPPPQTSGSTGDTGTAGATGIAPAGAAVGGIPPQRASSKAKPRGTESFTPAYSISAFSTLAVQFKVTSAGFGMDVATPLGKRLNARVGASFFSYSASYSVDGTTINGEAKLRAVNVNLDWFPFNGGFRISPGVNLYNGNNMNAAAFVPAGIEFDLGDAEYYSSPYDPIHGTASATFGNRVAPMITMGWGNMIPRSGKHVSFPFEFGIQFDIKQPLVNMYLLGSVCEDPNDPTTCGAIPPGQLQQEQDDVNNEIRLLRFYPIISQGISVRF